MHLWITQPPGYELRDGLVEAIGNTHGVAHRKTIACLIYKMIVTQSPLLTRLLCGFLGLIKFLFADAYDFVLHPLKSISYDRRKVLRRSLKNRFDNGHAWLSRAYTQSSQPSNFGALCRASRWLALVGVMCHQWGAHGLASTRYGHCNPWVAERR